MAKDEICLSFSKKLTNRYISAFKFMMNSNKTYIGGYSQYTDFDATTCALYITLRPDDMNIKW